MEVKLNWKKVKFRSDLPKDGHTFLCLWKGRISLCQYDEEEKAFYLIYDPAEQGSFRLAQERESKISHIITLDYPNSYPQESDL